MTLGQRWLSNYAGRRLFFDCARCNIHRRYDVDRTLAKMGDHNLDGMRVVLAEAEGCPRAFTTSKWDVCGMLCRVGDPPPNEAMAGKILDMALTKAKAEAAGTTRFAELQSWHILYAACRSCGRLAPVDSKRLTGKHGAKMMREVSPMLKCARCGVKGRSFFAVGKMPR